MNDISSFSFAHSARKLSRILRFCCYFSIATAAVVINDLLVFSSMKCWGGGDREMCKYAFTLTRLSVAMDICMENMRIQLRLSLTFALRMRPAVMSHN